jgi:3-deoxy-manno-octulosonate cytidylyltransferase (CMP-KDO synthetase)
MSALNDDDCLDRARKVKLVVLDVDGVLTDGTLCYSPTGEVAHRFNVKDGLGIELLTQSGICVILLSGRDSPSLRLRARELNVVEVIAGVRDKFKALLELSQRHMVPMSAICYIGDDLLDVPCLKAAGFAATVGDAVECAQSCAQYRTLRRGGDGAVRELAEYILTSQSRLRDAQELALKRGIVGGRDEKFGIIIPARLGSTRLPGKPLRIICGKPLIAHVYENALRANAAFTIVATDDSTVAETIQLMGGDVELTSSDHTSGTDRLAEVVKRRQIDPNTIIVNLQGDEPLLNPTLVSTVVFSLVNHPNAGIATIATPIAESRELFDSNVVKVVIDHAGYAQYFSRSAIPWLREAFPLAPDAALPAGCRRSSLRHVGLYGYRALSLLQVASLPQCDYEQLEALEQLRALYWGMRIHVSVVHEANTRGVDTESDLEFVEQVLSRRVAT